MRFLTYLLCAPLLAQPVLVPNSFTAPEPLTVHTPAGDVPGTLLPVMADRHRVTVLVLADTLDREKFDALQKTLLLLYPLLPKSMEFSLALLSGEQMHKTGPVQSREKLEEGLSEFAATMPQARSAVDEEKLYAALAKSANGFAGAWPMVMVAGVFPESELATYLPAYLERAFGAAKVRVNFLTYGGAPPALPGSSIFYDDARELAEFLKDLPEIWQELTWTAPAMRSGYRLFAAEAGDLRVPSTLGEPPTLEAYRAALRALSAMRTSPSIAAVSAVLAINPRDVEALQTGAELSLKARDWSGAAAMFEGLVELEPANEHWLDEWGNALYLAGRLAEAEKALLAARQRHFTSARNAEELGRIRVAVKDDSGALTYFAESLSLDKKNQALWFAMADAAGRLGDASQQTKSLEEGLSLGGLFSERRAWLVRHYLDHKQKDSALRQVELVAKELPADAAVRATFAGFFEELGRRDAGEALWLKALELDPKMERGHYQVARRLLDQKKYDEALKALEKGLAAQPDSARLYLAKADALEAKHELYAARKTIREAAARLTDEELLRRSAAMEDAYSRRGADAYRRLNTHEAWKRGLFVAVRDDNHQAMKWFAAKLPKADVEPLLGEQRWSPGGNESLPDSAATVEGPRVDSASAIARINLFRQKPLDEASLLLLSQNYAEYQNFFPYFAALKALSRQDLEAFFAAGAKLRQGDPLAVNRALTLFAPVVEILSRLEMTSAIPPERTAQLFRQLCEGMTRANRPQERASAALDVVRAVAKGPAELRGLLIGTDAGRVKEFERVLELQRAPSLAGLLELDRAGREMAEGRGDIIKQLTVIDRVVESLPVVDASKAPSKEYLESGYRQKKALLLAAELRQRTMRRKLKDIQTTVLEILDETSASTGYALMSMVYGLYLRPDDRFVADDPLFLRKHEFVPLQKMGSLFEPSELQANMLRGGFAQFALAAGAVASQSTPRANAEDVIAAELASLRSTDWRQVGDDELRAVGLRVRLAREWVVQAALDPKTYAELIAQSAAILSPARQTALAAGLAGRRWDEVWKSVSTSDLYFLGDRLLESKKQLWESPLTKRVASIEPWTKKAKLQWLGGVTPGLCGCLQPNLLPRPPYEDLLSRPRELAQRTAEIKLRLAVWADDAALPASSLIPVTEKMARDVFAKMRMADASDWVGALAAYRTLDEVSAAASR